MDYLIGNSIQVILKKGTNQEIIDTSINKFINDLCIKNLSTRKGREDAIKKLFGFHKFVPIYISSELLLLPISSKEEFDKVYINFQNVVGLEKRGNKAALIFTRGELEVNKSYDIMKKQLNRCQNILEKTL